MKISSNEKCLLRFSPLAFFCLFGWNDIFAQNIFKNASFEQIDSNQQRDCSINFGYIDALADWENLNTVDFAHTSAPFTIRSGTNKIQPFSGEGMIGVYLIDMGNGSLPEFFFQKLSSPLKPGRTYRISFKIHFRGQDEYFPEQIQLMTLQNSPCHIAYDLLKGETFSIIIGHKKTTDTSWIPLSLEFTPENESPYLIIGSFDRRPKVHKKRNVRGDKGIYAFFDDMELVDIKPGFSSIQVSDDLSSIAIDLADPQIPSDAKTIDLINKMADFDAIPSVSFDHNSDEIAPAYKKILKAMIPELIAKSCPLLLEGHTDKTGNARFNKQLSKNRARAVEAFLIENGFPANKIKVEIYGSSRPVALGEDEMSFGMNRRVDITRICK